MTVRQLGGLLGLAGGVVWLVRLLLAPAVGGAGPLRLLGLALVLLGLICVGLTLVKGSALWLDVVVGFAAPALFWATYELLRAEVAGTLVLHAALGALAVATGSVLFTRGGRAYDDDPEWDDREWEEHHA